MENGEPLLFGVVLLRILELFLLKKISQVGINLSFLVLCELPEVNYDCDQSDHHESYDKVSKVREV